MSKTLDKIVALCVKSQLKNKNFSGDLDRCEVTQAVEEDLKKKVYEEIKSETLENLISEANKTVNRNNMLTRIKECRKILISGILMAFFVGMSVNQFTNLIDSATNKNNGWSLSIGFVMLVVCYIIYRELMDLEILSTKKVE